MTLAQYIRSQFPNPVSMTEAQRSADTTCYCVGGALIMYKRRMQPQHSWESMRLPSEEAIAMVLREYQPFLNRHLLKEWATELVLANDRADFDAAWRVLGRALAGCVDHP